MINNIFNTSLYQLFYFPNDDENNFSNIFYDW